VVEANGLLGAFAAQPHEFDGSGVVFAVDLEDDVVQECAQQLLSVLIGCGVSVPDRAEVAGEPAQRALGVRVRRWSLALKIAEGSAAVIDLGQRLLKRALERSGDEPVLGLTGIELASAPAGLKLGVLDSQLPQPHTLLVLGLELIEPAAGRLDSGRVDCLQERVDDGAVKPSPADRLARTAGPLSQIGA
jgi:hypothetical protein